jgi:dynein heavy chain, axonemal
MCVVFNSSEGMTT